jgi:hypothetical protein
MFSCGATIWKTSLITQLKVTALSTEDVKKDFKYFSTRPGCLMNIMLVGQPPLATATATFHILD